MFRPSAFAAENRLIRSQSDPVPPLANAPSCDKSMRSLLAVGSLLLVAGSFRLWTPQDAFPRVPLFAWALNWSRSIDQLITWICLSAWLVVTALLVWPQLSQPHTRIAAALYAVLLGVLVTLDQHRLQPWGVHITICLLIVTAFEGRQLLTWLVAFNASIYVYSALSKFDAQFLHTVGQDFLSGLLGVWPGRVSLSEAGRFWLAALFPVGELVCGPGMIWHRSRRLAIALAISMHVTLIAILGPWCLNHSWGVLLWNGLFIGLNLLMWRQLKIANREGNFHFEWWSSAATTDAQVPRKPWQLFVATLTVFMLVVPLGERFGVVDHWMGWALYAPHSSRARIELLTGTAQRQPAVVQRYMLRDEGDFTTWEYLAIDRWSLEQLGVPTYPQQRFYVGVARAVAAAGDEFDVKVTLLDTASRWSGARKQRVLENRSELERVGEEYWFNTKPRFLRLQ